jgi:hypothetical protein
MSARCILMPIAAFYTLAGLAAVIIGFVIPWDDPLAAVYAMIFGVPWTFLLGTLNAYSEDSVSANTSLVTGSIALNAGLIWWWALTRRHRRPTKR